MRLGVVIGRVVLSQVVPVLRGGRWLVVAPFTRDTMQQGQHSPPRLSSEPTLVVYDDLGAGLGTTIGFVEGREAAVPFDPAAPVDALDLALVDEVFHSPS